MDVLMSLQQSQLEADDPTSSYMLQVWSFYSFWHSLDNICKLSFRTQKFLLAFYDFRHGRGSASALGRIFSHIWVLSCLLCSNLHNLSLMWPLHQQILIPNLMKMMTGFHSVLVIGFSVITDWYPWFRMILYVSGSNSFFFISLFCGVPPTFDFLYLPVF